ncbi:MAG TPA: preprotein translocase subunit SecG [Allosphingosinicella sp.]|jgi:preprotein translocase subunit SecG
MLFTFLLIVQTIVALAMVGVILMQRSEGGGLAGGGSPSGMMSARGAADFLTRATGILATIFVLLSIVLAALAANAGGPRRIDPSLVKQLPASVPQQGPTQPVPGANTPAAPPGAQPSPAAPAPAQPQGNGTVPR